MTFYSDFSDLDGKVYKVEITSSGGGEVNITMGGTPCIISSSSGALFDPIKSRSCSLEVVTKEWYFDLYEPTARGTRVKVYEFDSTAPLGVGKVIFRGFLTPCSYDQTWTYMDTITLEAVDGISTAKDFDWEDTHTYETFFNIILHIIQDAGYKGKLYVPRTYTHINENSVTGDVLDKLKASSGNFIDDDAARTPWTQYEVLSEIMQFLGWTLIPDGDDIWMIDYRAIGLQQTVTYSVYDIETGNLTDTYTSSSTPVNLGLSEQAGGTSQISIDDIYNKIEISDNLYKIDDISPDIFDDNQHISVTEEADLGEDQSQWSRVRRKKFLFWSWDSNNEKDHLTGTDYQTLCRLKPSSGWTHYYYRMNNLESDTPLANADGKGYYDAYTAGLSEQQGWRGSKTIQKVNTHCCLMQHYAYVDESHPNNIPATVDWTDILTFFVMGPTFNPVPLNQINNIIEKKVLEYNITEEIQWKPSSGKSWITLKGSLFYQLGTDYKDGKRTQRLSIVNAEEGWYATTPVDKSLKNLPADMNYGGDFCVRKENDPDYGKGFQMWKMRLQIGDKYWTGTGWSTLESDFYISFNNSPDNENDEYIPAFQWMSIAGNTTFKDQVGEDCYAIPIDSESVTDPNSGPLKLTVYTPRLYPVELADEYLLFFQNLPIGFGMFGPCIYAKDFELGYVYTDTNVWYKNHDDNNKADKVYIGNIDENFVQTFDRLEFKLNTANKDKPISKSYVTTNNGYLQTLKHICATNNEEKIQEYNIVDLYLDHHSERKPILEINVHGMKTPDSKYVKNQIDGTFVIDSQSFDVRMNNNRLKLIAF